MKALKLLVAVAVITSIAVDGVAAQDGGDAVAIQTNDQSNSNSQIGIAIDENTAEDIEQESKIDDGLPIPPLPNPPGT
jgi:hypothetical protein